MEVLLALAISAILLAAIGGIFFSAARLRERTTAMLDAAAPLYRALDLVKHDLRGALPPGPGALPLVTGFRAETLSAGSAENDRITLFTTTGKLSDSAPWSDIEEIIYELKDPAQKSSLGGKDLVRSVYRNLLSTAQEEPDEQVLIQDVQSLQFMCYDGNQWVESWDTTLSQTNLPLAVKISLRRSAEQDSLEVRPEPYELVVPILTQSRTNELAAASSTGGTQ